MGCALLAADVKDRDGLQGTWAVAAAEREGKPAADLREHRLTFTGNAFTVTLKGKTVYQGTYSLDPAAKPRRIDFKNTRGSYAGKTWLGIYELDGDTLKVCDNAPGLESKKSRPEQFAAPADSGHVFVSFKRAKE